MIKYVLTNLSFLRTSSLVMIMSLKKNEFCTMRMMMGRKEQQTKRISFFFEDSSCALWIDVESLTMPE